jgi:ABC-type multidrug transport system fused ATPase/permease subunit
MNLFNSWTSLVRSSGAGDKVFKLLDRKPPPPGTGSSSVITAQQSRDSSEQEQAARSQSSVELKEVHFCYPTRPSHPVLRGFNLSIPAGSTTALVGASGCGKSTVIGLLQRYYDPVKGSVLIDNTDLRSLDLKEYR